MSGEGPPERAALVTGGARGIGLAIVEALAARGDRVTIADVDFDNARASAADLEKRGWRVSAVALDVTDVEHVHRVLGEVDAEAPLTTIVCNAGLGELGGVLDTSVEQYDRILAVNLKGVFFTMQAALRLMVPRGTGSVVSISSTSGFTASSTPQAVYDLSKAAVRMLTTLTRPSSGRARVAGTDIADAPRVRERIGVTMQEAALDEAMTGAEHLCFVGGLSGATRRRPGGGRVSCSSWSACPRWPGSGSGACRVG